MADATKLKENQHVKPVVDVEAGTVTFVTKGHEPLVLHMDKLHPDIVRRAALVGMAQVRIVDAAAIARTDEDGNIIPDAERIATKYDNMRALIEHYESGTAEWTLRTGGGGNRSLTITAIARVKGIGYTEAEEYITAYAQRNYGGDRAECLAFLRTGARVMQAMADIRAERAPKPKVDADAALDEVKAQ